MGREVWRCLETWEAEPGFNMALDEALLVGADPVPVLRFYTWRPDALSLGYFQRHAEVPAAREVPCVVRRLTGGGAIHHDRELTFSIACADDHPLYAGEVRRSYERVHGLLARALARHGARPRLRGDDALTSDDPASAMCFHRSTDVDLVWGGAKGVGSAQRRTRGRVLHHGSIKLGAGALEAGIATLGASARDVAASIREVLEDELGIGLEPDEPREGELEHARSRGPFFRSETHVRRR